VTIQQLKREVAELKEAIKPNVPRALVIFLDEDENIVEISGYDITGWTQEEIGAFLDSVPIHFYFPKSEEDDEQE